MPESGLNPDGKGQSTQAARPPGRDVAIRVGGDLIQPANDTATGGREGGAHRLDPDRPTASLEAATTSSATAADTAQIGGLTAELRLAERDGDGEAAAVFGPPEPITGGAEATPIVDRNQSTPAPRHQTLSERFGGWLDRMGLHWLTHDDNQPATLDGTLGELPDVPQAERGAVTTVLEPAAPAPLTDTDVIPAVDPVPLDMTAPQRFDVEDFDPEEPDLTERTSTIAKVGSGEDTNGVVLSGSTATYDRREKRIPLIQRRIRHRKDIDKGRAASRRDKFTKEDTRFDTRGLDPRIAEEAYSTWEEVGEEPTPQESLLAARQAYALDGEAKILNDALKKPISDDLERNDNRELMDLRNVYRFARGQLDNQLYHQDNGHAARESALVDDETRQAIDKLIELEKADTEREKTEGITGLTDAQLRERAPIVMEALNAIADQWWEQAGPWIDEGMEGLAKPERRPLGERLLPAREKLRGIGTALGEIRDDLADRAGVRLDQLADVTVKATEATATRLREGRAARALKEDRTTIDGQLVDDGEGTYGNPPGTVSQVPEVMSGYSTPMGFGGETPRSPVENFPPSTTASYSAAEQSPQPETPPANPFTDDTLFQQEYAKLKRKP